MPVRDGRPSSTRRMVWSAATMAKKPTTGPRGRQGVTGPRGERGARGERGERGAVGAPGVTPAVLQALADNLEQMRKDAAVQFERIAQLQAQLDVALAELQRLKKQAKYDGPERRQTPRERRPRPSGRSN